MKNEVNMHSDDAKYTDIKRDTKHETPLGNFHGGKDLIAGIIRSPLRFTKSLSSSVDCIQCSPCIHSVGLAISMRERKASVMVMMICGCFLKYI